MASNGFEVTDEEYFSTLESQTLLIVAGPDVIVTTGIFLFKVLIA